MSEVHPVGDYFEDIHAQADYSYTRQLHLVFQRIPSSKRFWNDVMMNVDQRQLEFPTSDN